MENHFHSLAAWKKLLSSLTDVKLLEQTRACARKERQRTAWLVAHLAEVFRRELAIKRGYPSLFMYARKELGLSDHQAWERTSAARLVLEMPEKLEKIASGDLALGAAALLWKTFQDAERPVAKNDTSSVNAPSFDLPSAAPSEGVSRPSSASSSVSTTPVTVSKPTLREKRNLVDQVLGLTRRESETTLQTWKNERAGIKAVAQARPAASRKRLPSGTWTEVTHSLNDSKLSDFDRLRDLLSHKLGTRDSNAAMEWMISQGLDVLDPVRKEARKQKRDAKKMQNAKAANQEASEVRTDNAASLGSGVAPHKEVSPFRALSPGGSTQRKAISAAVKRRVWIRDQGKCQHTDPKTGRKCESTAFVDHDHRLQVAHGGTNYENNLVLACASHNRRRSRWPASDQPLHAIFSQDSAPAVPYL